MRAESQEAVRPSRGESTGAGGLIVELVPSPPAASVDRASPYAGLGVCPAACFRSTLRLRSQRDAANAHNPSDRQKLQDSLESPNADSSCGG